MARFSEKRFYFRLWHYLPFLLMAATTITGLISMGILLRAYPYDGMFLHCCDGLIEEVDTTGPAAAAQLQPGDRILLINGQPITTAFPLYENYKFGDVIAYTLVQDSGQTESSLRLTPPPRYEIILRLEPLLIGSAFWLIGFIAWSIRPLSNVAQLFFGWMQFSALLLPLGSINSLHLQWSIVPFNLFALLATAMLFHFVTLFPVPLGDHYQRIYIRSVYGLVVGLSMAYLWVIIGKSDFSGNYKLDPIRDAFIISVGLGSIFLLSRNYATSPLHLRQRRRLIITGMLLAICPTLFFYFIPRAIGGDPLVSHLWTFPFFLLIPLSFVYAIYAGELGKIDRLLNRGLVYTLLALLLLGLYMLLFFGSSQLFWVKQLWEKPVGNVGITAFVALAYSPTRNHLQRWVDYLFYGGWYNYRTVVRAASHRLSQELDLDQLSRSLIEIMQTMQFQAAALLWNEYDHFVIKAGYGYTDAIIQNLRMPSTSPLIQALRRSQPSSTRPGSLALHWSNTSLAPVERNFLESHQIYFWLPLMNRNTLYGFLLMGQRQGGELLDEEDGDVLATLAEQVMLAAENIALVDALRLRLTEVEQMRDELAETQQRLADAREAERQHLSRELHDGPVQDLYGIRLQLQILSAQLNTTQASNGLEKIQTDLQQVTSILRNIMNELRPPALSDFGLEKAIRSHSEYVQQKYPALEIQLNLMSDGQRLSEAMRLALFRIVQESLNNIIRHAQAQSVLISFLLNDNEIHLEIQDDGRGFDPPPRWIDFARQGHWGLLGMAERAEAIGGQLQVLSMPDAGTRLYVSVPLAAPPVATSGGITTTPLTQEVL